MTSLLFVANIRQTLSSKSETVSRTAGRGSLGGRNSESPIRRTDPLVDLLLNSEGTDDVARYTLGGLLLRRVLISEHLHPLPDQGCVAPEIEKTHQRLEAPRSDTPRRTTGA
jgi:hypothetical protein